MKKLGENHLCQRKISPAGQWLELQGLKIQHVTAQAVSQVDNANGIQEKFFVIVDCEMYRTRKLGESAWSPWVNGKPILFPPAINVEHGARGVWTASSASLQYLNPIGNQRPPTDPQAATNPASAGLPPGMTRAGSTTIQPPPTRTCPTPQPATPALTPISPPGPTAITAANPPIAKNNEVYQAPDSPAEPTAQNSGSTPADSLTKPFAKLIPLVVMAVVAASIISLFSKRKKRNGRPGKPVQASQKMAPPQPSSDPGQLPPPLPELAKGPAWNPIALMQRKDNLMTPAELEFFCRS